MSPQRLELWPHRLKAYCSTTELRELKTSDLHRQEEKQNENMKKVNEKPRVKGLVSRQPRRVLGEARTHIHLTHNQGLYH